MNALIAWFVNNKVAANLLMGFILFAGLVTYPAIQQEEFAMVDHDTVVVTVPYLGAAPAEVEASVCTRVEESVENLENIEKITSTAAEGACSVKIELISGTDTSKAQADIKSEVDSIIGFPAETEDPITTQLSDLNKVMELVLYGDTDERSLKTMAELIRNEIIALPKISQVEILHTRDDEISIEIPELVLRQYNLSLEEVGRAVSAQSIDIPGGSIDSHSGEILIRTSGQAYNKNAFDDIVLRSNNDGTLLKLGDIATIRDEFEDSEVSAQFNGQPAVVLNIYKAPSEDILDIAEIVKTYLGEKSDLLPSTVTLEILTNESDDLVDRLSVLGENARSGLLLVLLSLTLFLRFKLALWVAIGIPIALLGAVATFPIFGVTINTMSVIGVVLVLGIVVDDAIVVGERIFAHESMGKSRTQAAIDGTQEVSKPVIFGVFTTIAMFVPLATMPGEFGDFFGPMAIVVIVALIFSIIESQLILPSHLSHRTIKTKDPSQLEVYWVRFQNRVSNKLSSFSDVTFRRRLSNAIECRYVTTAVAAGLLILFLSLIASGRIIFQFFPSIESNSLYAKLSMPEGIATEQTQQAVDQLLASAEQLKQEINAGEYNHYGLAAFEAPKGDSSNDGYIKSIFAVTGSTIPIGSFFTEQEKASHLGQVAVHLDLPSNHKVPTQSLADRWREINGDIVGAIDLSFTSRIFGFGNAIELELTGDNFEHLNIVADRLVQLLKTYDGVNDISHSFRGGKQEIQVALTDLGYNLGLTLDELGSQIRQSFYGYEAQRIQRGREDVRVMVRYPETERQAIANLEGMYIRTNDGTELPFSAVATTTLTTGYTTIRRVNGKRLVTVTADVNRTITTPEEVIKDVLDNHLPDMLENYTGITAQLAGEAGQRADANRQLAFFFMLALCVVYTLLAIPLQSYLQPLLIMGVIPFGAIGAIVGHMLLDATLTFFSVLGIVALSGVVVNSSLILIDCINKQRESTDTLFDAIVESSVLRFRPIVLTSITTFLGLAPMVFLHDFAIHQFISLSISLAFGILLATLVTLILVPCLVLILDDITKLLKRAIS